MSFDEPALVSFDSTANMKFRRLVLVLWERNIVMVRHSRKTYV